MQTLSASDASGDDDTRRERQSKNAEEACGSKVFEVTELLEHILLQLPWKDLFVCQAVCQRFRDVVEESVLLRQKMFLLPREPLVQRSLEPAYDAATVVQALPCQISLGPLSCFWSICPALKKGPARRKGPFRNKPRALEVVCSLTPPARLADDAVAVSSWNKLYLTNPPVTQVWASLRWKVAKDAETWAVCEYDGLQPLRDPRGFTIEKVLHASLHHEAGRIAVEGSWIPLGDEDAFARDCKTSLEVVEKLEGELGAKAKFDGGIVRFFTDVGARELQTMYKKLMNSSRITVDGCPVAVQSD